MFTMLTGFLIDIAVTALILLALVITCAALVPPRPPR
ncbi:hypothetical protein SAMN05216266_13429 [Amycolatopsis marina]|jgi:hypothetical protein|uniref:Uncharacterized protein n=5 Tax=Pseudonocardiaceae TaxID=2070 RepID=A0A1I1CKU4_9PSEU|nr:hypothetical protein SaccyDRAFT_2692 [Saccharomonospora cyanea NA-134]MBE1579601.1 hypothetical protein [Amycolatopsis roodepoortensis]MBP2371306.1 hypothetical protein [Pseudonocardia parietis]OJG04953.1 hypothetical protein BG618_04011 [Pseudonocardia autotrophica]TQM06036.1 hypothetical protein FB558_6270 [Pseudonocardia kunmingensis]TWE15053.1 hypothetical protein FHX69_7232 [Prauserella muralis]SFB63339.1 hypothetical protein SAMN05216266_13429 [Amycolatopsis marina]